VCFMVHGFGSFHQKTAVLPKIRQRESGRGKSWCISSVSLSDQGVAIWGRTAVSISSSSGSSGSPERVQFHLWTRRVPSSFRNMPVWGMLNRLAEWWKGTEEIFVAWYILFEASFESTSSHQIRCLSCPFMKAPVLPSCPSVKAPIVPNLSSFPSYSRRKDLAACWHNSNQSPAMWMRCNLGRWEWERRRRV